MKSKIKITLNILIALFVSNGFVFAKSSIRVLDLENNKPIISANVKVVCLSGKCKDSIRTLRTNKDGIAYLTFDEKCHVTISYIGYKTSTDTIARNITKNILMQPFSVMMRDVVTTGQITPQSSQNSVFPVKVIGKDRIQAQAANNLRDLFSNELNIKIQQDNILGAGMSINGVSGQNVKIMIDGVPVIGRQNGNIDISQINLNNVERVEIVEGPMSTIYGTDALGGVVNIITKNGFNTKTQFSGNSYYESVGNYNLDFDVSQGITEDSKLNFNGGRYFFDGYSPIDTTRSQLWKPKEQLFGDMSYSYIYDKITLKAQSRYFYEKILNRGNPREPYFETAFDDTYKTHRFTNTLFAKGEISNNKFMDVTLSYSNYTRFKSSYLKDLVTLENILTNSPNDQDTAIFDNILFRATYSSDGFLPNLSYQSGIDFNYDFAKGARLNSDTNTLKDMGIFTSIQYLPVENFTIQPAARVSFNTFARGLAFSDARVIFIPSINMKYEFDKQNKLRFSYSRGFRNPSLKELFFYFVDINHNITGNANLKAEFSNSLNMSYSLTMQRDSSVYIFEPKVFYNNIYNQITLANVRDNLYSYINIGSYQTAGGEFQVKYFLNNLNFSVGMNYIGRNTQMNESSTFSGFRFVAEVSSNINYDIKEIEAKLNLYYKYSARQIAFSVDIDGTVREMNIDSYHLLDISLAKSFFDNQLNITIGAKNLIDVTNVLNSGASGGGAHNSGTGSMPVAWGRTFFTSLKFNL